jgi:hypothetical protein
MVQFILTRDNLVQFILTRENMVQFILTLSFFESIAFLFRPSQYMYESPPLEL